EGPGGRRVGRSDSLRAEEGRHDKGRDARLLPVPGPAAVVRLTRPEEVDRPPGQLLGAGPLVSSTAGRTQHEAQQTGLEAVAEEHGGGSRSHLEHLGPDLSMVATRCDGYCSAQ